METFRTNFPNTPLDTQDIRKIKSNEIPDCDGIIGGPPCQSWSEAGALRGIKDNRGKLFFDFVRIIRDKQPKFFLAENVAGMLAQRKPGCFKFYNFSFTDCGYNVTFKLLNAADYKVPQDRKRVIFVGYRKDLKQKFIHPTGTSIFPNEKLTLKDAIFDLQETALPSLEKIARMVNIVRLKIMNTCLVIFPLSICLEIEFDPGMNNRLLYKQVEDMLQFIHKHQRWFMLKKIKKYSKLALKTLQKNECQGMC